MEDAEVEDELDAFMNSNASSLKAETCGKIASRLADIKTQITQCSSLLALVAPIDLNKQKATVVKTTAPPPEQQLMTVPKQAAPPTEPTSSISETI